MWFTNAAINILTDFAIIILPIPVIRNLNLARRQKLALIGIFAVGGIQDGSLEPVSTISRQSSNVDETSADEEEKDVGIRVLTEVHISFDDEDNVKDMELGMKREDSRESLMMQDAGKAV
ncbi:uncharacterized protein N0V89_007057 [Didymosphaeria variabile]|uniref:Rhodopsin domain-containing protein n=1 Tax=Didymosphaeria variabile TaxID=1932322 RepID=A0A9W9C949_9PLEO|nr:uncharacterized protein N0V89_007057 [Didymosphaeria variabile]KAJ4351714.1 hypothetical protein N0V89_007057 [Didymosphaeria variabile]